MGSVASTTSYKLWIYEEKSGTALSNKYFAYVKDRWQHCALGGSALKESLGISVGAECGS